MGGTKVRFPSAASKYLGRHKAEMLNLVRDICANHIPARKQVATPLFQDFEVYDGICQFGNPACVWTIP